MHNMAKKTICLCVLFLLLLSTVSPILAAENVNVMPAPPVDVIFPNIGELTAKCGTMLFDVDVSAYTNGGNGHFTWDFEGNSDVEFTAAGKHSDLQLRYIPDNSPQAGITRSVEVTVTQGDPQVPDFGSIELQATFGQRLSDIAAQLSENDTQ